MAVENYQEKQAEKLAYFEEQAANNKESVDQIWNNKSLNIDQRVKRSQEAQQKADYYTKKAENIKNPGFISSDDPDAILRLKEKLQNVLNQIDEWKKVPLKPRTFDHSREDARHYMIPNLQSEKRRILKRIDALKAQSEIIAETTTKDKIRIDVNKEINRIMVYFPGKPDQEIRTDLKRHGFRWSPKNRAWQSYINDQNLAWAKKEFLGIDEGGFNE